MSSTRRVALAVLLLTLAACSRQAPPPSTPAAPPPPAAPAIAPPPPPAPAPALAASGDFAGTLPCQDCAGIRTELTFSADGSYTIKESYLSKAGDKAQRTLEEKGQWTASDDGRRLQFANGDSETARYFEIVSPDEIRLLDSTGNPIADRAANYSLRRIRPATP